MMHGFDAYHGPLSTQNECVSNINTPGSATPSGPFGPVSDNFLCSLNLKFSILSFS